MTHLARMRNGIVLLALLSFSLVTACAGSSTQSSPEPSGEPSHILGSQGGLTTTSTSTTQPAPPRIRINFAGDINFQDQRAQLLASDPSQVLAPIAGLLGDADLTVANLETALTLRGTPAPKAFTFRTGPDALDALRAGGIDVASIANNHGLDYGLVGVEDALAASEAKDFPLIGIGHDETEALAPYRTTIRGHRIAVIGATQVLDDELIFEWTATPDHPGLASAKRADTLVAAVEDLRPSTDTLVVFLHWGIERNDCPSEVQKELAGQLADAGADVIVGGHAHQLQGAGFLAEAVVHYGLGNFAFYAANEVAASTGVFSVEVGAGKPPSFRLHPARIDGNGIPQPLSGDVADAAISSFEALRGCTGLSAEPQPLAKSAGASTSQ